MEIAIFTDEIFKEDYTRALDRAVEWGVKCVEVRAIDGVRLPKVTSDVLDAFITRVRDLGLSISGLSPGFFKCDLSDPEVQTTFDDALPRLCEVAGEWGTDLITCFSFKRRPNEPVPTEVVDRLGMAADKVRDAGCRLVVENVSACWGATGVETGEIIRQVGHERLGLCWDPGNAARGGAEVPFPDDYDTIKDLVDHVHVKNYVPELQGWGLVDEGVVDWQVQVQALAQDQFDRLLVIETHLTERPNGRSIPTAGMNSLEMNTYDNLLATRACLGV
ncbi:MAG: sugar phosphate isomerase/epimerase [Candidatus Latescibacteria bacterium]|nr:sugar phosphate isomerase/epimerase [Candidatus Latescibacterota bacterium]